MTIRLTIRPPDTTFVAKVIVFDEQGRILLLKRKANQKYPSQWDLPGGHLLQGEDWPTGAQREVAEETNLRVTNLEKVFKDGRKQYYKTKTFSGRLFDHGELPEHDEYIWLESEKIDKLNDIGDIYKDAIRRSLA